MANKKGRRQFGSVRRERSGRWSARVPVPNSGGQHRSLGTFPTKRAADDAIAVQRAAIVGGTYVDPERGQVTLAEYAARFIATNGYRARSKALNERMLEEWIRPRQYATVEKKPLPVELGPRPLRSITADDVRLWHTAVTAASRKRALTRHAKAQTTPRATNAAIREWARTTGREVSATGRIPGDLRTAWEATGARSTLVVDPPATAGATEPAQAYRLLHAVLERAVEDGLIPANPARIKRAGEVSYPEKEPATIGEVRVIADAMPGRYRAAVWLAAMTSLRSGELFALRRRDYNARTRSLRIERAVELEAAEGNFGEVKADSSLRTVVVPGIAAEELERHLAAYTSPGLHALIFTTTDGGIVYPDRIGKHLTRARQLAGRPDLRWHDLRHTGQSLAARAGAGIKELQDRAGHSTTKAAVRYIHKYADSDQRVAESLDALARQEMDGDQS